MNDTRRKMEDAITMAREALHRHGVSHSVPVAGYRTRKRIRKNIFQKIIHMRAIQMKKAVSNF